MLDTDVNRASTPTPSVTPTPPPVSPTVAERPQEAVRSTVESAGAPSPQGPAAASTTPVNTTAAQIERTVARPDLSRAQRDDYLSGVIDAAQFAPDQQTRDTLARAIDQAGRDPNAAPALRESLNRLVAEREVGPQELKTLLDPDAVGNGAGTRALLTGVNDGALLNRVANDLLDDVDSRCWADQSAYAGAMASVADVANMAAANGAPASAKATAQAIADSPVLPGQPSLVERMAQQSGGMEALTGLLDSARANQPATDSIFNALAATQKGDAVLGFQPDAGNQQLASRMDAYFAQNAERLGGSEWVDRNEVDMAVRMAKADGMGGSALADVLRNPRLNESERNLVIQELARDPDFRSVFYANDTARALRPDGGALAADQRVIADAVQTAYAAGAITRNDLMAIADVNGVGNGAQRFMEVLGQSSAARMPGGAMEGLADGLWARNTGTDRANAAIAYTSSPEMMARNLTTPQMRAEAFKAIVEFTDARPFGSAPDSVADQWERSAIAASGRLFTAYAGEITDAFTASQIGRAPQTETLARFFGQTVFNPEASSIALDNRRDLQPAVRAAMVGVQESMFRRAEAAPAGSIDRIRAFEVLGQFAASVTGGAALALTQYTQGVEDAQKAREDTAGLIGAVVGDLVGARLPVGNTAGNIAESIAQSILDATAQNPDRPDQALAGVLNDQFSTAVDAERVKLNDAGAMAAFDGAYSKELLNLQNNLNVNLGAQAK